MFDFIRKDRLWSALDRGLQKEVKPGPLGYELKSTQDITVYDLMKDADGLVIGEVGGGESRILPALVRRNRCFNIDKFEGLGAGPTKKKSIRRVKHVDAYLGEMSPLMQPASFDIIFSISVIEHVPTDELGAFLEDGLRILKPGGLWLHAIDIYIEDKPTHAAQVRFDAYRNWLADSRLAPEGEIFEGPPVFTCDIATNPDHIMHSWGKIAPTLIGLRQKAQCVSLIMAARKK